VLAREKERTEAQIKRLEKKVEELDRRIERAKAEGPREGRARSRGKA
jgi:hypothetical protein